MLRGTLVPGLFESLQYIVIDELHSFLATPRGAQLQSLMSRVELAIRRRPPRIGLSATLGDMEQAAAFLRPTEPERVVLVESNSDSQDIQLQLRGYVSTPPPTPSSDAPVAEPAGSDMADEESLSGDRTAIAEHLFRNLRGQDNLVFANARRDVETYADLLAPPLRERTSTQRVLATPRQPLQERARGRRSTTQGHHAASDRGVHVDARVGHRHRVGCKRRPGRTATVGCCAPSATGAIGASRRSGRAAPVRQRETHRRASRTRRRTALRRRADHRHGAPHARQVARDPRRPRVQLLDAGPTDHVDDRPARRRHRSRPTPRAVRTGSLPARRPSAIRAAPASDGHPRPADPSLRRAAPTRRDRRTSRQPLQLLHRVPDSGGMAALRGWWGRGGSVVWRVECVRRSGRGRGCGSCRRWCSRSLGV